MRTKGRPVRVDWPEYYIACAALDCETKAQICDLGSCSSAKEAEQHMREEGKFSDGEFYGWQKRKGLWYCPLHATQKKAQRANTEPSANNSQVSPSLAHTGKEGKREE